MTRATILSSILLCALVLVSCDDEPEPDAGPETDAGMDAGVDLTECRAPVDDEPPPIPDPGTPSAPPALDCGVPEVPEATGLWRWPYLERATPTSVGVAWTSRTGGTAVIRYAADPTGPWTEVEATAEMFPVSRTGQAEDYVAYDVSVDGLEPNTAYCYEVVEDGVVLARNLRFDTAWRGTDRPVRILAIGDSGSGSENQMAVRDAFMAREFDVFLHLGDMAYGDGTFDEFEQRFFEPYQGLMHRVPVFPTMGNHEFKTDNGQPYRDVYHLFEQALREQDQELYYSFDYGNIHFTVLDSNDNTLLPIYLDINGRNQDDMFDWMMDDITSSDADWKIVSMHHPFYSSSERFVRSAGIERFRSLLEEAGVDLILVGHDHHYERTMPLRGNCTTPEPSGITEIIAGGAGASLRTIRELDEDEYWFSRTAYNDDYSYLSLEVHGCGLHGQAFNTENVVVDDFMLNGCDP